jgi:hypothetical protein
VVFGFFFWVFFFEKKQSCQVNALLSGWKRVR